nr:MAG TPA: hypothetical protein [Caudoviricetes sp.]
MVHYISFIVMAHKEFPQNLVLRTSIMHYVDLFINLQVGEVVVFLCR